MNVPNYTARFPSDEFEVALYEQYFMNVLQRWPDERVLSVQYTHDGEWRVVITGRHLSFLPSLFLTHTPEVTLFVWVAEHHETHQPRAFWRAANAQEGEFRPQWNDVANPPVLNWPALAAKALKEGEEYTQTLQPPKEPDSD